MNKTHKTLLISLAMACTQPALADDLIDKYFTADNPVLSKAEKAALALANKWNADTKVPAFMGKNGEIQFVYGSQHPSIVCAVLQVCSIALQKGELVNSIHLGDTARWTVEPAITGTGATEVQHLIIKPMDVGLETSLIVTTDRRTYHMRLRSHRREFMANVAFSYPEEALAKWDAVQRKEAANRERNTLPATGEYLGDLSFDYEISGSASWKPVRVYNNGIKTIIEMPESIGQTESPTLLVIRKEGTLFSDDETEMVNYRVQGKRYIVDSVFDKALLVAGVGNSQNRIIITREQ